MKDAYSPVPELNRLKELEEQLDGEYISDGFELVEFGEPRHDGWSDAPEFVDAFVPFAYANSSGSLYAFWGMDDRTDLASLPIVVFGDEGGIHLTALNLRDLLRQLACDRPFSVDWAAARFEEYEGDHRERGGQGPHKIYLVWLKQHFGLTPPADPNDLVEAAAGELGHQFTTWVSRYVDI